MKQRLPARQYLSLSVLATSLLFALSANAQDKDTFDVDLPSSNLEQALNTLAQQSRVQIIFASDVVGNSTTPALKGRYTAEEALHRLLDKHGLNVQKRDDQTFFIVAQDTQANTLTPPPPAEPVALGTMVIKGDVLGSATDPEVRTYAGSRTVIGNEQLQKASVRGVDEALQRVPGVKVFDKPAPAHCHKSPCAASMKAAAAGFRLCPTGFRWHWRPMARPGCHCSR